jgi:hypothetical protein
VKRVLAGALAVILLLGSAAQALAVEAISYDVTSSALVARGAGVNITFDVVCQPIGDIQSFRLEYGVVGVTEKVNGFRLASGSIDRSGGDPLLCDGTTRNALQQLVVTEKYPFKQGVALVHLHIYMTDLGFTVSQFRSEDLEIRIGR